MLDELLELLGTLGYPVYRQGSLLPNQAYPDHFFTFWNDSADGDSYFDNNENAIIWSYSLNFYSCDPVKVNSELMRAKEILKAHKWVVNGAGYDVMSDEPTHTGRGISIFYRQ